MGKNTPVVKVDLWDAEGDESWLPDGPVALVLFEEVTGIDLGTLRASAELIEGCYRVKTEALFDIVPPTPDNEVNFEEMAYKPLLRLGIDGLFNDVVALSRRARRLIESFESLPVAERTKQMVEEILATIYTATGSSELPSLIGHPNGLVAVVSEIFAPHLSQASLDFMQNDALAEFVAWRLEQDEEPDNWIQMLWDELRDSGAFLPKEVKEAFAKAMAEYQASIMPYVRTYMGDDSVVTISDPDAVGLDHLKDSMKRGESGYQVAAGSGTLDMALRDCTDRDVRHQMALARANRGLPKQVGNYVKSQNLALQMAKAAGCNSPAEWWVESSVSESVADLREFVEKMKAALMPRAKQEWRDLVELAGYEPGPGDVPRLVHRFRKEKLALDGAAVRPYLHADSVMEVAVQMARETTGDDYRYLPGVEIDSWIKGLRAVELHRDGKVVSRKIFHLRWEAGKGVSTTMAYVLDDSTQVGLVALRYPENGFLTPEQATTLPHEIFHQLDSDRGAAQSASVALNARRIELCETGSCIGQMAFSIPSRLATLRNIETGESMPVELAERLSMAMRWGDAVTKDLLRLVDTDLAIQLFSLEEPLDKSDMVDLWGRLSKAYALGPNATFDSPADLGWKPWVIDYNIATATYVTGSIYAAQIVAAIEAGAISLADVGKELPFGLKNDALATLETLGEKK